MSKTEVIIGIAIIAFAILYGYTVVREQREWEAFANSHDCKLIAHKDGQYIVGMGTGKHDNSQWVPSQDTYRCDDGVEYTR